LKPAVLNLKHRHLRSPTHPPNTASDEWRLNARDDAHPEFAFRGLILAALIALPFWSALAFLIYLFR
jgi:hypothetical protein